MGIHDRFSSPKVERRCLISVANYWEQVDRQDFTVPATDALRYLSMQLDLAAKKSFEGLVSVLRSSPEHAQRIIEINRQRTTVGASSVSKSILRHASSFEQMVALSDWLGIKAIRTTHTFVFAHKEEDYIPVRVNHQSSNPSTMMHVVLGTTSGRHKAPKYTEWAEQDPWQDVNQKRFIYPLESLEMVRQPDFVAATILKGNAFESEWINQEWRYGTEKACVELPGQAGHLRKKAASAGLNFASLVRAIPNRYVCLPIRYEDYIDEGYKDEVVIDGHMEDILNAAKSALTHTDAIDRIMQIFLVAKIGPVTTPALRQYIVREIF